MRLALVLPILLFALVAAGDPDTGYGVLTVEQVAARIENKGFFVFDCNPRSLYRDGHVPHAHWVDPGKLDGELPADRDATLVFYCANEH